MTNENNNNYQDFELGGEEPTPKINDYSQNQDSADKTGGKIEIDPTGTPPTDSTLLNTVKTTPEPKKDLKKKKPRKALLGCLGFIGALILGYLIFAFVMINTGSVDNPPAIARILDLSYASFINGLVASISIIFLLFAAVPLVLTIIALIKFATSKKDDKAGKKGAIKKTIIFASIFLASMIIWLFLFLHLDGKRVSETPEIPDAIVTIPEDTLGLTAPIEVRFEALNLPIDERQYQKISYTWDFGDESFGTSPITTHLYTKKGRFDVILTVTYRDRQTDEELTSQFTKTVVVEYQAITADFTFSPEEGAAPLEVTFDASDSVNPDGRIGRYEWDFTNNGIFDDAEGITTKHTFDATGVYPISLRVISSASDDQFDVITKSIVVGEQQEFTADIEITNESSDFFTGVSYIFKAENATSPNGEVIGYSWDFQDKTTPVNSRTTSHSFSTPGNYEVALTLRDSTGEEAIVTKQIAVKSPAGAPTAVIKTTPAKSGTTLSGKTPLQVSFSATDSTDTNNDIVDYQWDLDGDGEIDHFGQNVSYTYTSTGTYNAQLIVTDATGNEDSETVTITATSQGITADLKTDRVDGNVPLTVAFDASGSRYPEGQITSYHWNFGDGTSPKLGASKINHRFDSIGTYTVTLRVIGSDNTTDTITRTITVREVPLTACFSAVFASGKAPLTNTFDPSCSTGTVKSYFWTFGNGNSSTDVKPTHTFVNPGQYTVTLEIQDNDNTVSTTTKTITVTN